MTEPLKAHTLKTFDRDLNQLRGLIQEMGGLVIEQVQRAVDALMQGDLDACERVASVESTVNQFDLKVDEAVLTLFALRQPQAIDLRLTLALFRVSADLERIGDKAHKIARCSERLIEADATQPNRKLLCHIRVMHRTAAEMLEQALRSLEEVDHGIAVEVIRRDSHLDDEYDAAMCHLMTFIMEDTRSLPRILDLMSIIKALERVGDHAKNIAEQVVFVAKGHDIRYRDMDLIEDQINH
jgi:phosphate transport system protein